MFILKWIGVKILAVFMFVSELFGTIIEWANEWFKNKKADDEFIDNAVTMYKYFGDLIKLYAPVYKVSKHVVKSNTSFEYSVFAFSHMIVLNYYDINDNTTHDALNISIHYAKHKIDSVSLYRVRPIEIKFESTEAAAEFIKSGNISELTSITDQYQKDIKLISDKYKTEIELLKL